MAVTAEQEGPGPSDDKAQNEILAARQPAGMKEEGMIDARSRSALVQGPLKVTSTCRSTAYSMAPGRLSHSTAVLPATLSTSPAASVLVGVPALGKVKTGLLAFHPDTALAAVISPEQTSILFGGKNQQRSHGGRRAGPW